MVERARQLGVLREHAGVEPVLDSEDQDGHVKREKPPRKRKEEERNDTYVDSVSTSVEVAVSVEVVSGRAAVMVSTPQGKVTFSALEAHTSVRPWLSEVVSTKRPPVRALRGGEFLCEQRLCAMVHVLVCSV